MDRGDLRHWRSAALRGPDSRSDDTCAGDASTRNTGASCTGTDCALTCCRTGYSTGGGSARDDCTGSHSPGSCNCCGGGTRVWRRCTCDSSSRVSRDTRPRNAGSASTSHPSSRCSSSGVCTSGRRGTRAGRAGTRSTWSGSSTGGTGSAWGTRSGKARTYGEAARAGHRLGEDY